MARYAVFPGSFDPITRGHQDIVQRAAGLFDKVFVAIGNNTSKKYLLNIEDRFESVRKVFAAQPQVEVVSYDELTVDLCRRLGANYLVRGLRSGTDFDYERSIALTNQKLYKEIETVFFISHPDYAGTSSTIVREVFRYGGDISELVPAEVLPFLKAQR